MFNQIFLVFSFCLLITNIGVAEEFIAKGRIFIGVNNGANPSELNNEMSIQGFKEFKTIPKYGVDITYSLNSFLDVGFRYEHVEQKNEEETKTVGMDYNAKLVQDAIFGVARHTFLKTDILRADVFVAGGVSNTQFSIRNASQDGKIASKGFNSLTAKGGGSIGLGFKKVFLFLEAGYDYNKVSSGLERKDNVTSNIGTFDLSGNYIALGLLFDDITARR